MKNLSCLEIFPQGFGVKTIPNLFEKTPRILVTFQHAATTNMKIIYKQILRLESGGFLDQRLPGVITVCHL